jgi:hypothetical protein
VATSSSNPWDRVPIEQLSEIAVAIEHRIGDLERRRYGYGPPVGEALLSIYTHYPELLEDGETLDEVQARLAPLVAMRPGGAPYDRTLTALLRAAAALN